MTVFLLITYRHCLNRVYNIYQLHDAATEHSKLRGRDLQLISETSKQILRDARVHATKDAAQLAIIYVRIAGTISPQLPRDIFRQLSGFQLIKLFAKSTHFYTKNETGIQVSAFIAVLSHPLYRRDQVLIFKDRGAIVNIAKEVEKLEGYVWRLMHRSIHVNEIISSLRPTITDCEGDKMLGKLTSKSGSLYVAETPLCSSYTTLLVRYLEDTHHQWTAILQIRFGDPRRKDYPERDLQPYVGSGSPIYLNGKSLEPKPGNWLWIQLREEDVIEIPQAEGSLKLISTFYHKVEKTDRRQIEMSAPKQQPTTSYTKSSSKYGYRRSVN